MRVLMLSWEYPPRVIGGLGKHVMELVPALSRQGVEVHLITPRWAGGDEAEAVDGVHVYRVDPPPVSQLNFYTAAWQTNRLLEERAEQIIEECQFDLVHAHDWLVSFVAGALKRVFGLPLVATIHATERGRARGHLITEDQYAINSVEWWLAYEAWRVITCSAFMAQEVRAYFNCPSDKIDVIPNGVDMRRFDRWEGADLSHFRSMYALPDEKIIFYVGRIVHEKGLHTLIEAVPRVLAEFPDAKFVIAGTGSLLASLRRRAWELGVDQKVLFTGFISDDDRDRLYRISDCAVFPSLYEPFGIVALEAMAAKSPVVVSEVGGLKEVVQHAETGLTIYPGNVESVAWGILQTLQHPDWARQRVESAYRVVTERFSWGRIARDTIRVYQRVIDEHAESAW